MWWRNVLALNTNQPISARRFPARAGCHCVTARSNKHWSFLFTLSWKLNHWFCLHGFYLRLNMALVTFCSFSLHLMRRFQELGNFHFFLFPVVSWKMQAFWRNVTKSKSVMKHKGVTGTFGHRGQGDNDEGKNAKIVNFVFWRVLHIDPRI